MTTQQRAKKINNLLSEAQKIQQEAKSINGHDCFNSKSLVILTKLYKQIESAFTQLSKTA